MQRPPLCKNNPSSLVHDNKTLFATLDSSLRTFLTWPNLPDPMSELKNFTLEGMLFCVLIEKRRERNDAVRHAVAGCSSLFSLHLIKTYFFLSCYPRGFVNCILINLNGKRNKASGKRGKVWVFLWIHEWLWRRSNKKANNSLFAVLGCSISLPSVLEPIWNLNWNENVELNCNCWICASLPVSLWVPSLRRVLAFPLATDKDYACTNLARPIETSPWNSSSSPRHP